jgi:hypothetical protein
MDKGKIPLHQVRTTLAAEEAKQEEVSAWMADYRV